MINKVFPSADAAVADIPDEASVMIGAYMGPTTTPQNLILALRNRGARELTLVGVNLGLGGMLGAKPGGRYIDPGILLENKQVKKCITSWAGKLGGQAAPLEKAYLSGEVEVEIVPMGTLLERIRAGGAGIGGFYTPVGMGTLIEVGKEKKIINGKEYILELPLRADFALLKAYKADKMGNLVYRGTSRYNCPLVATAARVTIAEVYEIVEPGELDPDVIHTPGVYVNRIVKVTEER